MFPKDFVKAMLSKGELSGEMYLGYKDRLGIRAYLNRMIKGRLNRLAREGKLAISKGRYSIKDPQWMRIFQNRFFVRRTRVSTGMPPKKICPGVPAKMLRKK